MTKTNSKLSNKSSTKTSIKKTKIYTRISFLEREIIYKLHLEKKTQNEIAKIIGRNKSTVSRELTRCADSDLGYIPDRSNEQAKQRKRRNTHIFRSAALLSLVGEKLRLGWSPEQISGRLKLEKNSLKVSHETIYKFAYSTAGQGLGWPKLLSRKQPARLAKFSRKPKKEIIPNLVAISSRPQFIDERTEIGHWEADLIIFTSFKSNNLTSLVERKSRFSKLICNPNKLTNTVITGIGNAFSGFQRSMTNSVTFDRGTEFCSHEKLGIKTYFCDPHSPWQKGGVENFNGRIRRFLPKSFNHELLNQDMVNNIENMMNNQPRKCLGFNPNFHPKNLFKPL